MWSHIAAKYAEQKVACQLSGLQLSVFVDQKEAKTSYPKLKAKGAETKYLMPILFQIWDELVPQWNSAFYAPVRDALAALVDIDAILESNKLLDHLCLGDAELVAKRVEEHLAAYLVVFVQCCTEAPLVAAQR
jgi:hypothetical protein